MATKRAPAKKKVKAKPVKALKKSVKKAAPKVAKKPAKPTFKPISPKMTTGRPTEKVRAARVKLFVEEYLKANFNGTKAAIAVGYSPISARQTASELLALPEVADQVAKATSERAARVGIETDDILRRMHAIATADPRELISLHRCCCRFCYGIDNQYQWTPNELREANKAHARDVDACAGDKDKLAKLEVPDAAGGTGFNPYNDPNPRCPECFGEGVERVVPKDTRDISPTAMMLYAGVKTTQNGLEIKMIDQASMLKNVGQHLGMFTKKVELKGKVTHFHEELSDLLDDVDGSGTGLPGDGSAD